MIFQRVFEGDHSDLRGNEFCPGKMVTVGLKMYPPGKSCRISPGVGNLPLRIKMKNSVSRNPAGKSDRPFPETEICLKELIWKIPYQQTHLPRFSQQ